MVKLGTTGFNTTEDKFPGIYRGKVLSNTDSDMLGRIKVQAYPMFAGITDPDELPWAVPMYPIWDGAGDGIGHFAVPDVNTFVFVMFEAGDMYQPVYLGEAPTAQKGLPTERTTNYPTRKVIKSSSGITFYVDDTINEIKAIHPTGTTITVDITGKVSVYSVHNVDVTALKDIDMYAGQHIHIIAANLLGETYPLLLNITGNVDMNVNGKVDLDATQDVDITGANVNINP